MSIIPENSICRIHRVFCQPVVPEKWGFPPRRNRDQHIIYIRRGEGYYLLEQNNKLIRMDFKPGMVIYVPSGTLHSGAIINEQNRPRIVPIRFGYYSRTLNVGNIGTEKSLEGGGWYEHSSEMIIPFISEPIIHMTNFSSWWRETFEHICRINSEKSYIEGAEAACSAHLESLLRQLALEKTKPERGIRKEGLFRVRKLMDQFCDENYPLSWFASQAEISEKYFQKLFKQEFNRTPMEYYRQKRMERAVHLLQDTHMSVENVGRKLGFADGFSFSRAFKHYYGFSPGSMRSG